MKKLLLIRHAKATHESGYVDFERPLKYAGLQDAGVIAARLKDKLLIPEILVSSPALRTLTTANIFAEHLSLPQPATDKRIYDADDETLINVVKEFPANRDFIGLVGHNPGISELVFYFTGEMREMEPCAVMLIEFIDTSWETIGDKSGKLIYTAGPSD